MKSPESVALVEQGGRTAQAGQGWLARHGAWLLLSVPLVTLALATIILGLVARDGLSWGDLLLLFGTLWGTPGAVVRFLSLPLLPMLGGRRSHIPSVPSLPRPAPALAILSPIFGEDPREVMVRLVATWRSLQAEEPLLAARTRFHVLSDSRAEREEAERSAVEAAIAEAGLPATYRRRATNLYAKAGNVLEFLQSEAGHSVDFIIGFDADTVMSGPAISRLVRVMVAPANADVALVQQPIFVHRARTLIAAVNAARRPAELIWTLVMTRLLGGGNYCGHNFIARPGPLREATTRLLEEPLRSRFPGLAGYYRSHDFSEGMLLAERGYRVLVDDQVTGSYEETPSTLEEFLTRERRWLRGSLQWLVGGWARRGRLPQAFPVWDSIYKHVSTLVGMVTLGAWLLLLEAGDALPPLPSPEWVVRLQTLLVPLAHVSAVLLGITLVTMLVPGLVVLFWHAREHQPDPSQRRTLGTFLRSMPRSLLFAAYSCLVTPVISISLAVDCLTVPFQQGSWRPPRHGSSGYGLGSATRDLWPAWVLGLATVVVALRQPLATAPTLLVIGGPLMLAPFTAVLVSSERFFGWVKRFGLLPGVDQDVVETLSAPPPAEAPAGMSRVA